MHQALRDMGLGEKEIAILLVLFQYGANAVSFIAQKAGVNRATAYSVLRSLSEKKLVYQTFRGEIQQFVAHDPQQILAYLEERTHHFHELKTQAKDLVPRLRNLQNHLQTFKPRFKYFEGFGGMGDLLEETLKSEQGGLQGVFSWDDFSVMLGEKTMDRYRSQLEKRGLRLETKTVNSDLDFLFWDGHKCAFWGNEAEPFGVLVESQVWHDLQAQVFELWPE